MGVFLKGLDVWMSWPKKQEHRRMGERERDSDVQRRTAVARPGRKGDQSDIRQQRRGLAGALMIYEVMV